MQVLVPNPLPKPDCLIWYAGDPCDQQLQQYHQAVAQRQQQEWQNALSARYEKQIADQQSNSPTCKLKSELFSSNWIHKPPKPCGAKRAPRLSSTASEASSESSWRSWS